MSPTPEDYVYQATIDLDGTGGNLLLLAYIVGGLVLAATAFLPGNKVIWRVISGVIGLGMAAWAGYVFLFGGFIIISFKILLLPIILGVRGIISAVKRRKEPPAPNYGPLGQGGAPNMAMPAYGPPGSQAYGAPQGFGGAHGYGAPVAGGYGNAAPVSPAYAAPGGPGALAGQATHSTPPYAAPGGPGALAGQATRSTPPYPPYGAPSGYPAQPAHGGPAGNPGPAGQPQYGAPAGAAAHAPYGAPMASPAPGAYGAGGPAQANTPAGGVGQGRAYGVPAGQNYERPPTYYPPQSAPPAQTYPATPVSTPPVSGGPVSGGYQASPGSSAPFAAPPTESFQVPAVPGAQFGGADDPTAVYRARHNENG
jgi:hypothetical protein